MSSVSFDEPRVVMVVPAFNEAQRIGTVLEVAGRTPLVDSIIVVDDGSTDATASVARRYPVVVISLPRNEGKGAAMQHGIDAAGAPDIFLFSDADIVGLTPAHLTDLVAPLLGDPALVMTVGKFSGGRLRTDLSQTLVPSISGQRAIRREFLASLGSLANHRFGAEVAIGRHAKAVGAKVMEVVLRDVTHVMKEEKLGVWRGFGARLKMYWDMLRSYVGEGKTKAG